MVLCVNSRKTNVTRMRHQVCARESGPHIYATLMENVAITYLPMHTFSVFNHLTHTLAALSFSDNLGYHSPIAPLTQSCNYFQTEMTYFPPKNMHVNKEQRLSETPSQRIKLGEAK